MKLFLKSAFLICLFLVGMLVLSQFFQVQAGGVLLPGDDPLMPEDLAVGPAVEVNDAVFRNLNPLVLFGSPEANADFLNPDGSLSVAGVFRRSFLFLFPIAGLILFIMLIWGGFEMLSQAATKKSVEAGRNRAVAAVIGFILLFSSYWIIQVVEAVLGVVIF